MNTKIKASDTGLGTLPIVSGSSTPIPARATSETALCNQVRGERVGVLERPVVLGPGGSGQLVGLADDVFHGPGVPRRDDGRIALSCGLAAGHLSQS
jgi:hypothetical protein